MEVVEYTEKSIAVFGNTKDYKEELKDLGGKYNPNLQGQPGWIFSKQRQDEVVDFVDATNNASHKRSPKVITNNPKTYVKSRAVVPKVSTLPKIPPKILPKSNLSLVDNANTFVGQDGLRYQIIVNTCPLPYVGQKVLLVTADDNREYIIEDMNGNNDILLPIDEDTAMNAVIINGKWQIPSITEKHELIFQ